MYLKLTMDGKNYVAKHFFATEQGQSGITARENATALTQDLICLKQGGWLMSKFYERAATTGTEVAEGKY